MKRGEVIAHSGNSGHSFAPHLHYQLMSPSDRVLDPFDVQPTRKVTIAAADRPALAEQVARWRSMMTTPVAASPPRPVLQAGTPASARPTGTAPAEGADRLGGAPDAVAAARCAVDERPGRHPLLGRSRLRPWRCSPRPSSTRRTSSWSDVHGAVTAGAVAARARIGVASCLFLAYVCVLVSFGRRLLGLHPGRGCETVGAILGVLVVLDHALGATHPASVLIRR